MVRLASKYFLELSSSSPMKKRWHSSGQPRKARAMVMARISPDGNRENSRHGFGEPGWSDRDSWPQARLQDSQADDRAGDLRGPACEALFGWTEAPPRHRSRVGSRPEAAFP